MNTVYTLQLENGKYYVGNTNDLNGRLKEHRNGNGSEWTRLHKVIKVYSSKQVPISQSLAEETKQTSEMMLKFGPNNVRGAEYTSIRTFSEREIETNITSTIGHHLNLDFNQVKNKLRNINTDINCFKCGQTGHYANQCSYKISRSSNNSLQKQQHKCYRCGRSGHYANNCYAKTILIDSDFDSEDDGKYF